MNAIKQVSLDSDGCTHFMGCRSSTGLSFCRRSRFFSVRLTVSWLVPQLHNLPGQQPQRPVGVPLSPLVQGDDPGFRLAVSSAPAGPLPFQSPTFFDEIPANDRLRPTRKPPRSTPARRRRSSKGARRTLSLPPLRTVSWRISRSSAVNRTFCTWECLSVAQTLDRWHYISIFLLRQRTSYPDLQREKPRGRAIPRNRGPTQLLAGRMTCLF